MTTSGSNRRSIGWGQADSVMLAHCSVIHSNGETIEQCISALAKAGVNSKRATRVIYEMLAKWSFMIGIFKQNLDTKDKRNQNPPPPSSRAHSRSGTGTIRGLQNEIWGHFLFSGTRQQGRKSTGAVEQSRAPPLLSDTTNFCPASPIGSYQGWRWHILARTGPAGAAHGWRSTQIDTCTYFVRPRFNTKSRVLATACSPVLTGLTGLG